VTIDVVTDATIMLLPASNLHKAFAENRDLKFIMNCLIGKDITR
jgi:hypothetical protein